MKSLAYVLNENLNKNEKRKMKSSNNFLWKKNHHNFLGQSGVCFSSDHLYYWKVFKVRKNSFFS